MHQYTSPKRGVPEQSPIIKRNLILSQPPNTYLLPTIDSPSRHKQHETSYNPMSQKVFSQEVGKIFSENPYFTQDSSSQLNWSNFEFEGGISVEDIEENGLEKTINKRYFLCNQRKDSSSHYSSENCGTSHLELSSSLISPFNLVQLQPKQEQQRQLSSPSFKFPLSYTSGHHNNHGEQDKTPQSQNPTIFQKEIAEENLFSSISSLGESEKTLRKNSECRSELGQLVKALSSPNNNQYNTLRAPINIKHPVLIKSQSDEIKDTYSTRKDAFKEENQSQLTATNYNNKKKMMFCNCKKTKCLKLYCDCFARGELCGLDCKCSECNNNDHNLRLRNNAIEKILEKNPQAFNTKSDEQAKIMKREQELQLQQLNLQNSSSLKIVSGCNCRKSYCQKKYCLCYQQNIKCTDLCKCTECKNIDLDDNHHNHPGNQSALHHHNHNHNHNSNHNYNYHKVDCHKNILVQDGNLQQQENDQQTLQMNCIDQILQVYQIYGEQVFKVLSNQTQQQQQQQLQQNELQQIQFKQLQPS